MTETPLGQLETHKIPTRILEPIYDLEEIVKTLSRERLKKYFERVGPDDIKSAVALYCWNHEVGAAFNVSLQQFEICLRNQVSKALQDCFGPEWFKHWKLIGYNGELGDIIRKSHEKARENRNGFDPLAPDFVAASSMSLWRELCKPEYAGLFWGKERLYIAFPRAPQKADLRNALRDIHGRVQRLVKLRNRIAHHEPILGSHREPIGEMLKQRHQDMFYLLELMDRNFCAWIKCRDTFTTIIANCPCQGA